MACKDVILYCLRDDKQKSLYMFNTDATFSPNIFNLWLAESMDAKPRYKGPAILHTHTHTHTRPYILVHIYTLSKA